MKRSINIVKHSINDNLSKDSLCYATTKLENNDEICKAEYRFYNGNRYI